MTDRLTTLLHAVLARPEDDNARLVYADALEEAGDGERAEFIRVSIQYANEARKTYRPRLKKIIKKYMRGAVSFRAHGWLNWLLDDLGFGFSIDGWGFSVVPVDQTCRISRGFVESVHCSLAAWCGEECWECQGRGYFAYRTVLSTSDERIPCRCCQGGRTPGRGPEIVARHPVERVEFTDREPWVSDTDDTDEFAWSWWRETEWANRGVENPRNRLGNLPDGLFVTLVYMFPENTLCGAGPASNTHVGYPSRESALAAMSDAAIRWARTEAVRRGLVPDVWQETTPPPVAAVGG